MYVADYTVPYDPEKDTQEDLVLRIINSLLVLPLKRKQPRIVMIAGKSGRGKSWTVLRFMELALKAQDMNLLDWMDITQVYTPIQYPEKLRQILFDKKYKKVNTIAIHEARQLVRNTSWNTFLTQSIGDVNAMSRSVKRLLLFVVSQSMRDIAREIRYTLDYYIVCNRRGRKKTEIKFYKIYMDERDLDNPKIKKTKIRGFLIYPDGTYRKHMPKTLEINRPSKEVTDIFEKLDTEAKGTILWDRLEGLVTEMRKEMGMGKTRIKELVDFYLKQPESLLQFGKFKDDVFVASPAFSKHHNLKVAERKIFEQQLNAALGEKFDREAGADG